MRPCVRAPESSTLGGYAMAVDPEAVWLIGGETGDELKERDSSSWKYRVGSVEPLMRLMAIEPSILSRYVMNQFS